jgi:hypothetical protein
MAEKLKIDFGSEDSATIGEELSLGKNRKRAHQE